MPLLALRQPVRQAARNDEAMQKNFVEYGRRLEKLIAEIKAG
jgi:hypothetical protein